MELCFRTKAAISYVEGERGNVLRRMVCEERMNEIPEADGDKIRRVRFRLVRWKRETADVVVQYPNGDVDPEDYLSEIYEQYVGFWESGITLSEGDHYEIGEEPDSKPEFLLQDNVSFVEVTRLEAK